MRTILEGRQGGENKRMQHARRGRGSNPGHLLCAIWAKVPSCTPRELFGQVSISVAIDRVGQLQTPHVFFFFFFWR